MHTLRKTELTTNDKTKDIKGEKTMGNGLFNDKMDRMESSLTDIARVSMSYYQDLLAQGFSKSQATEMVLVMQKSVFGGNQ